MSLDKGRELRQLGLFLVESHGSEFQDIMRAEAIRICAEKGSVIIDELRAYGVEHGIEPHHFGAWGAIFNQPCWVPGPERVQTAQEHCHAREIRRFYYRREESKSE